MVTGDSDIEAIERAMVAIRRSQTRRSLAKLSGVGQGSAGSQRPVLQGTSAVFDVLDVLEAAEQMNRSITVSGVADALAIDQPRASRLVAAAVDSGLVRRIADQADGRRAMLLRSANGRRVSERIRAGRRSVFAAAIDDWSDADRATFARLLTRFVDSLDLHTRTNQP
jgi:DNA-binding MarR family transcriptional regulator